MIIDTHIKEILGVTSCILGIIAYTPYLRDIYRGKTHPHTFSWLVWTLVIGTGYFGQVTDGGGAGAWSTGVGALLSLTVFVCSLKVGEKNITLFDWICLTFCMVGICMWWITETALWTMIIISLVDTLAFLPTFKKGYYKPYSETLSLYYLCVIKMFISIVALENLSLITTIFPATIATTNTLFTVMVLNRRKVIPNLHI